MKIHSKLPHTATTIFTVMSALASEHKALNLSQGFPDFDVDPDLLELVAKYMRAGYNQYAPMQGVPELRERIAEKTQQLYNAVYDPATEITVTSGATEALFAAITAVVQTNDEVIVMEPAFDCYVPAIRLNGGIPVFVKYRFPDYRIDWDDVQRAITSKTRLMILNSPHNPTGAVLSGEDISALKRTVRDTDVLLVSDEVYEHIIFDDRIHESICRHPELAQRSFVISSFGKTYHTTGWKIGYCLAPEPLSAEFQRVHQFLTFASNTPIQHAYAEFMQKKDAYLALSEFYQNKRDKFLALIEPSRFKALPCRGTYFQMLDYSAISNEPDMQFAKRLTIRHGVASIPPSVFYHDNKDHRVLRFCFAKKDETLERAAEKLCAI
ncbi:MAG: methionine aminotransferase [Desulfobacterales bacterium]|uniref:Methionine aminotransferase n=1 Tax=Candidatus Desulfatibia profunda TaxID=2841695 RepID=A0A8J6TIV5_9BACT|nr:methionine aminotransferase [Candidatus Desulfatibia profunda]MBL7178599.1 methionine aminotransferase [Desulfobacterales bacterium]